jgi:hypothetical protein
MGEGEGYYCLSSADQIVVGADGSIYLAGYFRGTVTLAAGGGSLHAVDARAVDKIDLLTVVEHELGHILGFDDLDASADGQESAIHSARCSSTNASSVRWG